MSLDEPHRVDLVATKGNKVLLFIIENRRWEDIDDAWTKLFTKLEILKRHIFEEAGKKFKNKQAKIAIDSRYNLPSQVVEVLKKDNVGVYINHKQIK